MGKFEYTTYTHHNGRGILEVATLNKLGQEGWELVSVVADYPNGVTTFYLKRDSWRATGRDL